MGNSGSQSKEDDEERQPILSGAATGIQSSDDGYGSNHLVHSQSSPELSRLVTQNGLRSSRSSVKLKTEMKRDPTVVRKPFVYRPLNATRRQQEAAPSSGADGDQRYAEDDHRRGIARRLLYFHRLDRRPDSILVMPDHVVPEYFWEKILGPAESKHSSIVTIFSLWNTMMGTSLLSIPWAIHQAGFVGGITLLVVMALIMFYTSYLVLKSVNWVQGKTFKEFSDVCGHFLGRMARYLANFSSIVTLLGGMIVYWILLSNFLYHIVVFIHGKIYTGPAGNGTNCVDGSNGSCLYSNSSHQYTDAICKASGNISTLTDHSTFNKVWTENLSVPLILVGLLIWLVNFKSATIFTKLNSLGVISVVYLLVFTCVKAAGWGIHLNLGFSTDVPSHDPYYSPDFKPTFPALTGICALAYFVQNCVIAITRNNQNQENNIRDLSIAYGLVAFCYIFVGALIYISFPLAKSCIEDNFLNNLVADDLMAFIAHVLLFFQMTCVFPLLCFILRSQLFLAIYGNDWPSFKHVIVLTVVLFTICVLFAIFVPRIGHIIGFVGAFCGLAYAIALPCGVYIQAQRVNGTLTKFSLVVHSILIVIGAANFIGQFLILGKTS
ncbi:neutral amino acid transporter 9-like [Babylonia areolata]|uniref:neutral amino acid transporter 9-like n=1 Tax=Babylonia areolata TaxID=304850 RepID=UPI003FD31EB9